ncbi:hypothetical protein LZQ00_15975 [Sphingobacterium sp. SRCM116780]|uniref:hypothetical protein n=1 Tax=Sphingobacterium sp. SRCM116780 TaxID=2907623 RepID=UPI001F259C78|nr:hypothetical protein [Sphingobacterium sp. SRCM116780]UIR55753.1 hypothetical protein LZQ00_15975 [Sphingobacterium sp. SRCM116780]
MDQTELQEQLLKEISKPEFIYTAIAVFTIRILIWLLFANTMRKTLKLVAPENQCIKPNQVFGVAIPLFNIYWNFEVAKHLRDSLINEFFDRKIAIDEAPTYKKGSLYGWVYLVTNIPFLPSFISILAVIFHFVTLINYWVDINNYKRILEQHNTFRSTEELDNTHEN